ncbi:IclR family transcriptional regulator [Ornithinimicrobium tianjinense]|uniref:Glycerol operon regulatory protein n=1 Tax=Ornithinimicrobium tianjinense TaxID=1195761 RepID=A0A917BV61_9MICO|nr:IclR family transcriptional regulator [Ornithinimicrobium tianjinense]GGF58009.1 IclR family transcriptional regulator [Ornithinimicrobium tianjinense]
MANARAAAHALDVLTFLARHATPQPAAAIARELGLPRSTTYHLLTVLVERGFVVHLPEERRYGLGVAAFELGSAYSRHGPLQRLAAPVLRRLADSVQENAHLAVLHGRDIVYLVEERVAGRPSLVSDVGVRLPASLTATGLAILSALPAAQVRALFPSPDAFVQRHGAGPTSLTTLHPLLAQARAQGYAAESGYVTPGLNSVAAPVLDHGGHPVAGVAVTAEVGRMTPEAREEIVRQVRRTTEEISRRLGGRSTSTTR